MRTETLEIYTFDELSKEAKQHAIEQNRYTNVDMDNWYEPVMDQFHNDVLEKYGVDIPIENLRFTGFCSQGDGASFTVDFTTKELSHLLTKLKFIYSSLFTLTVCENSLEGSVYRANHYYCHKYTVDVSIESIDEYNGTPIPVDLIDAIDKDIYRIENVITEWKNNLCDELYKRLEIEYDYLTSDGAIKEMLIANECEFLADGTPY